MSRRPPKKTLLERGSAAPAGYDSVLTEVVRLLEDSRRASAKVVDAVMTATYWEVGRQIVEGEQSGGKRELWERAPKAPLCGPDRQIRAGILTAESRADAPLLPRVADSADSVCGISLEGVPSKWR